MLQTAQMPSAPHGALGPDSVIDPGVRIGHVHLKVADLDRALEFLIGDKLA